jgi:hypothetical protein
MLGIRIRMFWGLPDPEPFVTEERSRIRIRQKEVRIPADPDPHQNVTDPQHCAPEI